MSTNKSKSSSSKGRAIPLPPNKTFNVKIAAVSPDSPSAWKLVMQFKETLVAESSSAEDIGKQLKALSDNNLLSVELPLPPSAKDYSYLASKRKIQTTPEEVSPNAEAFLQAGTMLKSLLRHGPSVFDFDPANGFRFSFYYSPKKEKAEKPASSIHIYNPTVYGAGSAGLNTARGADSTPDFPEI